MLSNLTAAELSQIEHHGAYSNLNPEAVLPHLAIPEVDRGLLGFQLEYNGLLEAAAQAAAHPVSEFTLRRITHVLLRFSGPSWGGTPTVMKWLDVLKKCDTKSKLDTRRINAHGWANPPRGCTKPAVQVKFGDGQTNHRDRDEKKDNPELNKGMVVAIGNFHPSAHFLFVCICGWWYCIVCRFVNLLGLQKVCAAGEAASCSVQRGLTAASGLNAQVYQVMKDLEHDNYSHAFTFLVSRSPLAADPLLLTLPSRQTLAPDGVCLCAACSAS